MKADSFFFFCNRSHQTAIADLSGHTWIRPCVHCFAGRLRSGVGFCPTHIHAEKGKTRCIVSLASYLILFFIARVFLLSLTLSHPFACQPHVRLTPGLFHRQQGATLKSTTCMLVCSPVVVRPILLLIHVTPTRGSCLGAVRSR